MPCVNAHLPDAMPPTTLCSNRKVLHFIRTYLRKTETFIYSQIQSSIRYQSWILARNDREGETSQFPFPNLLIYTRNCSPSLTREWGNFNYRFMKRITSAELRFYLGHISALEPDLVHIHFGPDAGYLLPVICKVSVPTVVSFYGYDASSFPRRYFGLGAVYLRRMFHRVRMILAMSEDMKSDLIRIGCPPSKIRIHYPNGVDLEFFSFNERPILYGEKTTILNIAAMVDKKGQLDLLEAFAYALRRFPHTELRIVGEGFMRGELEERIRGLHLQDHVKLLGHLPYARLPEELSRAHIFCHPSITTPKGDKEGIPSIILEAAATGLPVVATYHAGIPEAVVNGKTGFLVTEHDTVSLGRRILELLENPEQRRHMGIAGRRHIQEHFDVNKLAEKRETIYDELLV